MSDPLKQDEILDRLTAALVAMTDASRLSTEYSKGFAAGMATAIAIASGCEDDNFYKLSVNGADIANAIAGRLYG